MTRPSALFTKLTPTTAMMENILESTTWMAIMSPTSVLSAWCSTDASVLHEQMWVDQSIYPQRSAQFFEIIVLCAPLSTNACPILVWQI